jgi:AcrR family transcriptional regulator
VLGAGHETESTRDRILDVALDLFIEKGFDKTSLREIAEELGFSKAAIYYHFASKDEILMALHMRLHQISNAALVRLGSAPADVGAWARLLDELIDEMLANRKIFLMHERNRSAFEQLHRRDHDEEHEDFEDRLRQLVSDDAVPLRDRVRIACALGAMMGGLVLSGDMLADVPTERLGDLFREVIADLLGPPRPGGGAEPTAVGPAAGD